MLVEMLVKRLLANAFNFISYKHEMITIKASNDSIAKQCILIYCIDILLGLEQHGLIILNVLHQTSCCQCASTMDLVMRTVATLKMLR